MRAYSQPWIESPLISAVILEQLDSQDEKTQTTAVLGACKMLLMQMVDSSDVSRLTFIPPLGDINWIWTHSYWKRSLCCSSRLILLQI